MPFFQLIFFILVIIPSSILHEFAHAWTADRLGDPTPERMGRLTLNPIPHIDLWGTLVLPILLSIATHGAFLFAYAKPVPFNPLALKWQKWGSAAVGAAGPLANLLLAFALGMVVRFMPPSGFSQLLTVVVYANLALAVFNLLPIPPLDGSHIFYTILPDRFLKIKVIFEQYGLFILLFFLLFLSSWLVPVITTLLTWATGPLGPQLLFGAL